MCWTKEHVKQWIQWAIKEFSLRDIDVDCFDMTGKELCKLTREDFLKLAPAYNGDILMAHLCVLRRSKLIKELITTFVPSLPKDKCSAPMDRWLD